MSVRTSIARSLRILEHRCSLSCHTEHGLFGKRGATGSLAHFLSATRAAGSVPVGKLYATVGASVSGRPLEHGLQMRDFAAAIVAVAAVLSPEEQIRVPIDSTGGAPAVRAMHCGAVQPLAD